MIDTKNRKVIKNHQSSGYNPLFWSHEELTKAFHQDLCVFKEILEDDIIEQVYFYGAGCSSEDRINKIKDTLTPHLPNAKLVVETDLLGAARGLLHKETGIAAILGTGANSCLYRKEEIIEKPVSLGYLLSDFGSGATLGLTFLQKLLTTQLSMETISHFIDTYNLNTNDILESLYKKKNPNTFCASFAPFIIEHHQYDEHLKEMILEQFAKFIQYYIIPFYKENLPIKITGSIAHHFSPLLLKAFEKVDIASPQIIKSPTQGLIDYHINL